MKRNTRIVGAFVATIPVVILAASTACAWAIAHGAGTAWRLPFRLLCHGITRRCLTMFGTPMPVCARCTGIYIGMIAGLAAFALFRRIEERVLRMCLYMAALPIAIDGITQAAGLRESTNTLRMVTGFIVAFAFGVWVLNAVEQQDQNAVIAS